MGIDDELQQRSGEAELEDGVVFRESDDARVARAPPCWLRRLRLSSDERLDRRNWA